MSAAKRSVATDALEVLGFPLTTKKVGRDAVHLACMPVVVGDPDMIPGEHVGLKEDGTASRHAAKKLGIIDPFLSRAVTRGEEVLLIIYPRKIESLRHVWSHPDIPDEPVKGVAVKSKAEKEKETAVEKARAALTAIGTRVTDSKYGAFELLTEGMDEGYIQDGGRFEGYGHPEIPKEAWDLFEIVFGRRARKDPRESDGEVYFSCSC